MMNTPTGRTIAEERHNILVKFLAQFYYEWHFIKNKS
jgi:HD superfamily phosphodiesterase